MINTTFNLAHKANACASSYKKLAKYLGGIEHYGKDTPIPLTTVLESNGLQDTIWAFRCTIEPSENIMIEFACRCAEHVLHFYEDKYPEDQRPRQAIEAARHCITDKSPAARAAAMAAWDAAWDDAGAAGDAARAAGDAARAAGDAARDAAWAAGAAGDAAWAAARDAAGDAWAAAMDAAETKWQKQILIELLEARQ